MPIVTCPDCGHEISDSAITCPNCGYPYEKSKNIYLLACRKMAEARTSSEMLGVAEIFDSIGGFQDSDILMRTCREKAREFPATNDDTATEENLKNEGNRNSFLYAILLTIFGAIIVGTLFVDGYCELSFRNSSLSGGTRYYDSNFPELIGKIPIAGLILLALLVSVLLGVIFAWITAVKNNRLEIYCVIATAVTLAIILICSVVGPNAYTEHNNYGLGFYSYQDFEEFGPVFYIQVASAISSLAVSIVSKVKSV